MFKPRIQNNFNQAASTYDQAGDIQRQSAQHLVDLLIEYAPQLRPDHIIDIGSGTGFVINALHQHFPHSHYIANDISTEMLAVALKKLPQVQHLSLHPGDAENIFIPQVDVIMSNLAFQWFQDLNHCLGRLWKKTNCLAFATLTADTFQPWQDAHHKLGVVKGLKQHHTAASLEAMCRQLNPRACHFDNKTYHLRFDTPADFLKYVKMLGIATPDPSYQRKRLPEVLDQLKGGFIANYEIFFAILEK